MDRTISSRLLKREIGAYSPAISSWQGLYGDRHWVNELDIVNELEGHSGCVNALSWSRDGTLLASGSDDKHLNLYAYQAEDSVKSFKLAAKISTGHTANIFSVKFMPHSNNSTLVSAAGDAEIRIFDIEHLSGRSSGSTAGGSHRVHLSQGARYIHLSEANRRVYRSHSDRVKRIVTESSPHLFLSCSEDGEVRQWDLRQPSSYYPRPGADNDHDVPPPLISYQNWQIDLNTISCSPSQPYYIALGGAHLHCFLHDRRMLGRDLLSERGASSSFRSATNHDSDALSEATRCVRRFAPIGQERMRRTDSGHITACKISDANPNEMVVSWSGEWIYSFDLVRSPDARDHESRQAAANKTSRQSQRVRNSGDRKRKRMQEGTDASVGSSGRRASKQRRPRRPSHRPEGEQIALRVRYENGQSENIPLENFQSTSQQDEEAANIELSEDDQEISRFANAAVKIKRHLFNLGDLREYTEQDPTGHKQSFSSVLGFAASVLDDLDARARAWRFPLNPDEIDVAYQNLLRERRNSARRFIQAAGTLARLLGGNLHTGSKSSAVHGRFYEILVSPSIEQPSPSEEEIFCYDFLRAIILWLSSGPTVLVEGFTARTGRSVRLYRERFPISNGATIEAIEDSLIPYLLRLADVAGKRRIPDVDSSRFEVDENRQVFETEKAAVMAFSRAVKIPFSDLSDGAEDSAVLGEDAGAESEEADLSEGEQRQGQTQIQSRGDALRYWGYKVARGVLLNAARKIDYAFVTEAYGGHARAPKSIRDEEHRIKAQWEELDSVEIDPEVTSVGIGRANTRRKPARSDVFPEDMDVLHERGESPEEDGGRATADAASALLREGSVADADTDIDAEANEYEDVDDEDDENDEVMISIDELRQAAAESSRLFGSAEEEEEGEEEEDENDDEEYEGDEDDDGRGVAVEEDDDDNNGEDDEVEDENDEDEDDDDDDDDDDDEDEDDEDEDNDLYGLSRLSYVRRSAFERSVMREKIHSQVPCFPHTRVYKGHCNVRTVKDVNFYGPNDEYVVSGSDSGHVFIWDKKTSQLVNILEGDGEVVNVVQGHPYEPCLAVSGIDHTIKIFSPDRRARSDARNGIGIRAVDPSSFSSLRHGSIFWQGVRRQRSAHATDTLSTTQEPGGHGHRGEGNDEDNASDSDDTSNAEPPSQSQGLRSRRRMHEEYQITSQNDVARRGGNREAYITRSMLAQLAARMTMARADAQGAGVGLAGGLDGEGLDGQLDDGEEGDELPITVNDAQGRHIVVPDDCEVM